MSPRLLAELVQFVCRAMLATTGALTLALVAFKLLRGAWGKYARRRAEIYTADILRAVADESSTAVIALRRVGDRAVLETCLLEWAEKVQGYGLERLGAIYIAEGYAAREARRLDGSLWWWVRARAARRLGVMRCSLAADALTQALHDPSMDVRLQAAWALGRLGSTAAAESIVAKMANGSHLAAQRVANVIQELGPRTIPILVSLSAHPQPRVRRLAVSLLGSSPDATATNAVSRCLRDDDAEVRVAACRAHEEGTIATDALLLVLADAAPEVRAAAAEALGRRRVTGAADALRATLRDRAWEVRFSGGEALARLGEPGVQALRLSLEDSDLFARDMAAQWLDEFAAGAVR